MSVINQMLNDLDQRQSDKQAVETVTVPVMPTASNKKKPFVILAVILLLNVCAVYVWQLYQENLLLKNESALSKAKVSTPAIEPDLQPVNNIAADIKAAVDIKAEKIDKVKLPIPDSTATEMPTKEDDTLVPPSSQHIIVSESTKQEFDKSVINESSRTAPVKVSTKAPTQAKLTISRKLISKEDLVNKKTLQAEQFIAANNLVEAERLFEDILLLIPEHKSARKQLAALWFGGQSYQAAINLLTQGIALYPNDSEFRLMKARIYLNQNRLQNAFATLNEFSTIETIEYQTLRAQVAQQAGEFSAAVDAYQMLLSVDESQGRWWLGLAVALDSQSKFSQAISAYQKALTQINLSDSAEKFSRQRLAELGEQ